MKNCYSKNITISNDMIDTIDPHKKWIIKLNTHDLSHHNLNQHLSRMYIVPIHNILKNSKHKNNTFLLAPGDHNSLDNIPAVMSKSRLVNDVDTILLRLNYERHWGLVNKVSKMDIPWKAKNSKIIWRGATTGQIHNLRQTLVEKYYNHSNKNIDVGLNLIVQGQSNKYKKSSLSPKEMLKSKFIVSIEGNDVASGLKWQMFSNSVVFMPKPLTESWFMENLLIPYYHYIPLNNDLSDLEKQYNWALRNQEKCKKIVDNAKLHVKQFLNEEYELSLMTKIFDKYFQNVQFI